LLYIMYFCFIHTLSYRCSYFILLLVQPINYKYLGIEPFTSFMIIIPANYYAIMSLLIVFLTIYWQIDFSAMEKHEKKALETMDHNLKKEAQENVTPLSYAFDLMLPILTLVISTIVL